ncbi:MAG: XdhC/CoxI family protein [Gammaproteobacteria bacterium]|nr:XdhC/CoxI family protein [Gammaproteobacteria bacterium]NDF85888.1 XdhC/CoxI family protein [Gammaproteobacteria bacterium]
MITDFFENERLGGRPLVAAFVIATQGSTYRKPGAMMLFSERGERHGLLSGGCLEGDLQEHALRLLRDTQRTFVKTYDSRGSDDPVWGLGLGCEGLMQVLLLRVDVSSSHEPLNSLFGAAKSHTPVAFSINIETGSITRSPETKTSLNGSLFTIASERVPKLLLCGAGPDAEPVAALAVMQGWEVTLVDHRSAYIDGTRFAKGVRLLRTDPDELDRTIVLDEMDAAVVMSHHLIADGKYLAVLARSKIPYVGLLGPAARRERLFAELGSAAEPLRSRLRAPVGLDLGGRTPEAIALSIVAEIQAALHGRGGAPFSGDDQASGLASLRSRSVNR